MDGLFGGEGTVVEYRYHPEYTISIRKAEVSD